MRTMRILMIFLMPWFMHGVSIAQDVSPNSKDHPIYRLEQRIQAGEKEALTAIAPYFDNTTELVNLGYHGYQRPASEIAKRIVSENCLFTDRELIITKSTTTKEISDFLNRNAGKITFLKQAGAFIFSPLEQRPVTYKIRAISETQKKELKSSAKTLLSAKWIKANKIDQFIRDKNSAALLMIAMECFRTRQYPSEQEEFSHLLQYLTGTEIGVIDEEGKITWHIDKNYDPQSKLNLLIYFSKYYKEYAWDEKTLIFIRRGQKEEQTDKETQLFQLLSNKKNAVAIDAFARLTECQPYKVIQLADEYCYARVETNDALPTFPYKFLKQLVLLTDFCRSNNISYKGTEQLRSDILLLKKVMPFAERRKLEDRLINKLTPEDITSFEYWTLIYEPSREVTYSAGRILDVFYSKHFNEILGNVNQLEFYLKKSALFEGIGIIGICNYYLKKFTNARDAGIHQLDLIKTTDKDITNSIAATKLICRKSPPQPNDKMKVNDGNEDYDIHNVKEKLALAGKCKNIELMEDSVIHILSQISYVQIGEAMAAIEKIKFREGFQWKLYSFLESDFGFFVYGSFDTLTARTAFLNDYKQYSEVDFYRHMLDKAGVVYKNADNSFDYDRIFEALKFDVVTAFVGGVYGKADNEVYAIVKVLELTHHTTLGYPKKLCNSNGVYVCNSDDRARYWMEYLTKNNLLKKEHKEPISFND